MSHLAAFVGISAMVICTPGPDTALIVRNTLVGGRANGVRTAAGIAVWTLAAAAGIAALVAASHPLFTAIRVAGAVYLVWLGSASAFVSPPSEASRTRPAGAPPACARAGASP